MRIRYTRRARADLASVLTYLKERSDPGAENVSRALKIAIDLIGRFPEIGRLAGESETRVLPVGGYPYLIYWIVTEDEVRIVHIRHAARARPAI